MENGSSSLIIARNDLKMNAIAHTCEDPKSECNLDTFDAHARLAANSSSSSLFEQSFKPERGIGLPTHTASQQAPAGKAPRLPCPMPFCVTATTTTTGDWARAFQLSLDRSRDVRGVGIVYKVQDCTARRGRKWEKSWNTHKQVDG